jgi:hypothetical protein
MAIRSPRLLILLLFACMAHPLGANAALELQRGHTLVPRVAFTDQLGEKHTRLRHYFKGVRVWGSEATLHLDPGGRQLPDAAPAIWYRALTVYLKPGTTYLDARIAAIQAAKDLFPDSPREVQAMRMAFAAINVGFPEAGTEAPPTPPEVTAALAGGDLTLRADGPSIAAVTFSIDGAPVGTARSAPFDLHLGSRQVDQTVTVQLRSFFLHDDARARLHCTGAYCAVRNRF